MARPKKNHVQLSDADVKQLKGIIKKKDTNQTTANRCRVLIALNEDHPPAMSYDQCVDTYGVSGATIATLVKTFRKAELIQHLPENVVLILTRQDARSIIAQKQCSERLPADLYLPVIIDGPSGYSRTR